MMQKQEEIGPIYNTHLYFSFRARAHTHTHIRPRFKLLNLGLNDFCSFVFFLRFSPGNEDDRKIIPDLLVLLSYV